ncbi:NAD(P)/FAD-dependent oxidoreductase [Candidatus Bathyarchaeota archaeon]|nr:NAD(P)/FAD-dependent oxidoreductase [Candidatus Bathyarchaeota archaeon]
MTKYVIIGGSAGGIGAVEAIRQVDPVGEVTVISNEQVSQYSRPMISEYVSREATLDTMKYRSDEFWKNNKVKILTGKTATKIDFANKYVELDGEEKISYDKLLIATGGKPFVPRMEGGEKEGVFTFTELSNAEAIEAKVGTSNSAVVIGGGLIGVSASEALVKRGIKVTLVELKDNILNLILDKTASLIAEKVLKEAGVTVITGKSVQRILGRKDNEKSVGGVILTDGKEISCDFVVVAIGVIPRTELVKDTLVEVNRGIIVDRFMKTNLLDVYACGDVAEAHDFLIDGNRLLPLWPLAHLGGKVAGYNMAGKQVEYEGGTVMSSLKYFELPIIAVGIVNPENISDYEVLSEFIPEKTVYKKILLKNNKIAGFIFLGNLEKVGIHFRLLKNRVNVTEIKEVLLSEDFGIVSLPEQLRLEMFVVN